MTKDIIQMIRRREIDPYLSSLVFVLASFITFSCNQQWEKQYYDSGELKLKVRVKDGLWNGESVEYYKSGETKITSRWKNGARDGKTEVYFESGVLKQESYYSNGVICCEAKIYREDKTLHEVQVYKDGEMVDFKKFNRDGKQNTDITSRKAIFNTKADTIYLGDYYYTEIRLGNRRFDSIKVISGNLEDKGIIEKAPLPMKDSVTAIFRTKPEKAGENFVEGVIIEINVNYPDSLLVIPFRQSYYVKVIPPISI